MLVLFFSSILIISVLSGWGTFFESVTRVQGFKGISGKILTGIFGITLLYTVLSFFIALNLWVEIPVIFWGLFYFFKHKLYSIFYALSKNDLWLLAMSTIIILFCSSFYPYILDHFGYYVPTVAWLKEYGLIKGISNLDLTLGQMSLWHIFQAGFSNFSDPFLRMNGILLMIYLLYIIENKSWIQLCFIPVLLLFSQSPSPDLPVIIFSLIILNEILSGNQKTSFIFAFSVFVFAIKPTMIWLPVLSFFYTLFITRSHFKNLAGGIVILFLFFIKNIWTFGYPVFPVSLIDLGFSWKPSADLLHSSSQYAIIKTYDNQYTYDEIQKFSPSDYVKNWFFLRGIKSAINILLILSLLVFSIYTYIKKSKIVTCICISLFIKSIAVLLFSAQYRFFFDVFFVIVFVMFLNYFSQKKLMVFYSLAMIFFTSFITFPTLVKKYIPSYRMSLFMGQFESRQLYRPSGYDYKKFNTFKVGNLKFNVSQKYPFNFDTPLPSISESYVFDYQKAGIFPQLIDQNNIRKGFVSKQTTAAQEKEVEKAILIIKKTYH